MKRSDRTLSDGFDDAACRYPWSVIPVENALLYERPGNTPALEEISCVREVFPLSLQSVDLMEMERAYVEQISNKLDEAKQAKGNGRVLAVRLDFKISSPSLGGRSRKG